MKAICIEEPGKVVVKDIDKPVRKPGEALLKMLYGGICGSDLGRTAAQTPTSRTRVSRGTNSRRKSSKSTRTTKASNLA